MNIDSPLIDPLLTVSGSVVITGSVTTTGDILPAGPDQNLGSLEQPWEEIFVTTGSINFVGDGEIVKTLTADNLVTTETLAQTLPSGVVSSSAQVSYSGLSDIPAGIVSSSVQVDVNSTTGTLSVNKGGTGQTTYTNGQLLIGNTTGNTLAKATLTGTSNQVTVTNGAGSITLSTPQDIHTSATPTFGGGTYTGNLILSGSVLIQRAEEKITTSATAATGTVNYDVLTQPVLYYTSNASGNWTLNLRGNASTTLNNSMAIGRALTIVFMVTNGGTAYRQTGFQIDGSNVTPKWQGGSAPSAGNINSVDSYTVVVFKTANATFSVFEALTRFA